MQSPPFPRSLVPPRSKYSQHHILKHPQLPFLPQCQRPFGLQFSIIFGTLLFILVTCSQFELYLLNCSSTSSLRIPWTLSECLLTRTEVERQLLHGGELVKSCMSAFPTPLTVIQLYDLKKAAVHHCESLKSHVRLNGQITSIPVATTVMTKSCAFFMNNLRSLGSLAKCHKLSTIEPRNWSRQTL